MASAVFTAIGTYVLPSPLLLPCVTVADLIEVAL